jgi:hypothetical protein
MCEYIPFAGPSLHGLPAKLASRSSSLTAGASFWAIFARRIASNLALSVEYNMHDQL